MKAFSEVTRRKVVLVAATSLVLMAGAITASAIPTNQVARVLTGKTITATCCVPIGLTVSISEPTPAAPVIVTFSSDYSLSGEIQFNLSVNGGPCQFYGASVAPWTAINGGSGFLNSTFQWIIFPADGLKPGANTFAVCGGGVSGPQTINLGFRTLSVQIGR